MSVVVKINTVDKSSDIQYESLVVKQVLTNGI